MVSHLQTSMSQKSLYSTYVNGPGGNAFCANFDYISAHNKFIMSGNVATQIEYKLKFELIAVKIVNNSKADGPLRSDYRQVWSL